MLEIYKIQRALFVEAVPSNNQKYGLKGYLHSIKKFPLSSKFFPKPRCLSVQRSSKTSVSKIKKLLKNRQSAEADCYWNSTKLFC